MAGLDRRIHLFAGRMIDGWIAPATAQYNTTGANFRPVTREPDPRIRRKKKSRLKMMDCRVKFATGPTAGRTRLPGNDSADRSRSNTLGITTPPLP